MILYQTVEDRDNPEHIKSNSPFLCNRKDAWLGKGYYFWDTLIENAHWWGKTVYKNNDYVVLKFLCDSINIKCFDLHGNLEHLSYFNEVADILKKEGLVNKDTTFIRSGLSANASIILAKADNVLALKEGLIQYDEKTKKAFVEVETEPQKFERRDVELGVSDGIYVEIKSGITKNDKVKIWNQVKK